MAGSGLAFARGACAFMQQEETKDAMTLRHASPLGRQPYVVVVVVARTATDSCERQKAVPKMEGVVAVAGQLEVRHVLTVGHSLGTYVQPHATGCATSRTSPFPRCEHLSRAPSPPWMHSHDRDSSCAKLHPVQQWRWFSCLE